MLFKSTLLFRARTLELSCDVVKRGWVFLVSLDIDVTREKKKA